MHHRFEEELRNYLGANHVSLTANGTLALTLALRALKVSGEVITTPFSFIATSHALLWSELSPVFVDIDPESLNIDIKKIESAITEKTTAILAVHCYGNPCNYRDIDEIAKKYDLKVIYDGAHAFGVECDCGSILNHGDISIVSFHATKVLNTFEGGAVVSSDANLKSRVDDLKNFGIADETHVVDVGINAKMSEVHAAMGVLQLRYIDELIRSREAISEHYAREIRDIQGLEWVGHVGQIKHNYSYAPILVTENFPVSRDDLYLYLKAEKISCRRYFYPLISSFSMYAGMPSAQPLNLRNAHRIASQILCLPIYPGMHSDDLSRVIRVLQSASRRYRKKPMSGLSFI